MIDIFSIEKRSWNMRRIRAKNTKPELIVRSILHQMGYRFRLHRKDLPGKPDIVLPKYRAIVFVNGCFWHQHFKCKRATIPTSNKEYWIPKLERNKSIFMEAKKALKKMGWKVIVIWECQVKEIDKIKNKLNRELSSSK